MRSGEIPGLVDFWVASWREAMPHLDFEARRGWIETLLRGDVWTTLVLDDVQGPAGFASFAGDHLEQLVVAPRAKGKGLAARLLAAVKHRATSGITLDVNQSNERAVAFYRREGFSIMGAGANAVSGEPTWAMRWRP